MYKCMLYETNCNSYNKFDEIFILKFMVQFFTFKIYGNNAIVL